MTSTMPRRGLIVGAISLVLAVIAFAGWVKEMLLTPAATPIIGTFESHPVRRLIPNEL